MYTIYFVIKSSAVEHQKKEEDSKRNPLTIWKTRILQTQIGNMYEISGLEFGRTTAGREPEPDSFKRIKSSGDRSNHLGLWSVRLVR